MSITSSSVFSTRVINQPYIVKQKQVRNYAIPVMLMGIILVILGTLVRLGLFGTTGSMMMAGLDTTIAVGGGLVVLSIAAMLRGYIKNRLESKYNLPKLLFDALNFYLNQQILVKQNEKQFKISNGYYWNHLKIRKMKLR
jgi:hypothetical protein